MTDWYNLAWNDVVNLFQSNSNRGLDENKVLKNRDIFGKNVVEGEEKKLFVSSIGKELFKPWIIALIISSILYFSIGSSISAIIVLIIVFINVLIISLKKYKEQKKFLLLHKINSGACNVIRNGNLITVNNRDIVVGDIIIYKKDSIIPADIRITSCDNLRVIEESVTGDSNVVEKYSARLLKNDLALTEMKNILFKSSLVYSGNGEGIVVAVGANTEIGKFAKSLININLYKSNVYENIYKVLDKLSIIGGLGGAIAFIFAKSRGSNFNDYILVTVTVLITLLPLGLISIIALMYFFIRKCKAKEKIFINNILKIEDIANINILCIDKKEILTENLMNLKKIYDTKQIQDLEKNFIINDNTKRIMETGILCNDVKLKVNYSEENDLVEQAFMTFGNKYNMSKSIMEQKQKRVFKLPYDKENVIKTTINRVDRKYRAYAKGAVEILISRCTHIMKNGIEREITKEDIEDIKAADMSMSSEGLYVYALAYRNFNYKPGNNENIESNLVFAGLSGFDNPVKKQLKKDIEKCRRMSIKPVIFTDANKINAEAFGKGMGILNAGDMVLSDIEMDYIKKGELEKTIEKVSIFSRIQFYNKLKIINQYKDLNYRLILTGNKLIDSHSFIRADLHISFGDKCNEIVKKLSDVYFEKIDFNKILYLIEESKNFIYAIRKIIKYLCIFSLSEFLICMLSILFNLYIPFYFKQVLWNNIFNGFLVSLAVLVSRKNIKYYENIEITMKDNLLSYFRNDLLVNSISLGFIAFLSSYFSQSTGSNAYETVTLSVLYFSQLALIVKKDLLKNLYFDGILAIYAIVNFTILYADFGRKLFDLKSVSSNDIRVIIVSIILYIVITVFKNFFKEKNEDNLSTL